MNKQLLLILCMITATQCLSMHTIEWQEKELNTLYKELTKKEDRIWTCVQEKALVRNTGRYLDYNDLNPRVVKDQMNVESTIFDDKCSEELFKAAAIVAFCADKPSLIPKENRDNFNTYVKELEVQAESTQEVIKTLKTSLGVKNFLISVDFAGEHLESKNRKEVQKKILQAQADFYAPVPKEKSAMFAHVIQQYIAKKTEA